MTDNSEQPIGIDGQPLIDEYQAYRRWGARLIVGGFIFLVVSLSISAFLSSNQQAQPDTSKIGIHLLLDDGRHHWDIELWDAHLTYAGQVASEGGIAVQVIRSDDLDPTRWQVFMDLAQQHNLTPVLRLATTFDFENGWWSAPETDADGSYIEWGQQYAAFINSLEWHTDEKHVILLNEPNNGHEWGGTPDPAAYANFVANVTGVLRSDVEGVVILNGAFDLNLPHTNGLPFPDSNTVMMDANSYMDAMETAQPDIFSVFDVWNSHPYPLDIRQHPNEQLYRFDALNGAEINAQTPPTGIYNRGVNGYEWELWKLAQLGYDANIPIMITETGWRHNDPIDPSSADSATDYPSPEALADYFELALVGGDGVTFTPWLLDDRVIAIAPFALNGIPNEWSHTNILQINLDGDVLGTYSHFESIAEIADSD